jgi:hypothetical protein
MVTQAPSPSPEVFEQSHRPRREEEKVAAGLARAAEERVTCDIAGRDFLAILTLQVPPELNEFRRRHAHAEPHAVILAS